MADLIQLLPDSIANQIAAGEVIQRPASVVKELLENSVDSGATSVQLIVKDAGKTLVQVIDNGSGMTETDARMSLERHATSKIRKAEDLFSIRTMGFRGEALASVASISQLDIKTRVEKRDLGTHIEVEGSKVNLQEPVQTPVGTSIAVKNLFFNVPARRKFLKSHNVETRHIIDEFERVALVHPEIEFSFHHNNNELFRLPKANFRQRAVGIFGKRYNQLLVPVEETTNLVKISGFLVKPEAAKKTRGEQFFFVNQRFIKSSYLHHAIQNALSELIPKGYHAGYFLLLEVEPDFIDINIHPTKTEIKFEDERAIYAILNSSVKQAIGKFNVAPSLDFDQETSFNTTALKPGQEVRMPQVKINQDYNPFEEEKKDAARFNRPLESPQQRSNRENWEKLYTEHPFLQQRGKSEATFHRQQPQETISTVSSDFSSTTEAGSQGEGKTVQLHKKFILAQIRSGFVLIHQHRAHERILFEKYIQALSRNTGWSQQQLFPQNVEFNTNDAEMIRSLLEELQAIGFDINEFGKNTFVIQGMPTYAADQDPKELLEGVIEDFKQNEQKLNVEKKESFARSLARKTAIKAGKTLNIEEMQAIIDELFGCENPYTTPSGKTIVSTVTLDELNKRFN